MRDRRAHLRAVMRRFARDGSVTLFDYLVALSTAGDVLGQRLPGPLGTRGYQQRVVGMCLAAIASRDVPSNVQFQKTLRP